MNPPKWPLSTMKVGEKFIVEKPPKNFVSYVHHYGAANGKLFRTVQLPQGRKVTRIA